MKQAGVQDFKLAQLFQPGLDRSDVWLVGFKSEADMHRANGLRDSIMERYIR